MSSTPQHQRSASRDARELALERAGSLALEEKKEAKLAKLKGTYEFLNDLVTNCEPVDVLELTPPTRCCFIPGEYPNILCSKIALHPSLNYIKLWREDEWNYVTEELMPAFWIRQVELGTYTATLRKAQNLQSLVHGYDALRQGEVEPRCMALIGVAEGKPFEIDIIFAERAECRRWFRGLKDLMNYHLDQEKSDPTTKAAVDLFVQSDLDGNGSLDMKEAIRAFRGVGLSKAEFLKLRAEVDVDDDAQLDFGEFISLMSRVRVKDRTDVTLCALREEAEGPAEDGEEINGVLKKDSLGLDAIVLALEKLTKEEGSADQLRARAQDVILQKYSVLASIGRIDHEGLRRYMGSRDNSVNRRKDARFTWKDYDFNGDKGQQPITRYMCDTSHNTFLEGDQLAGEVSVKAYVMALARGCKCIEADCHDGDLDKYDQPMPIITRGASLTGHIKFSSMCRAVAEEAFSTDEFDEVSTYPLILCLEVHTSAGPQTDALAKLLIEHMGDHLAKPVKFAKGAQLPSLDELRNKIILCAKVRRGPGGIDPNSELAKLIYLQIQDLPTSDKEWAAAHLWPPHYCLNITEDELKALTVKGKESLKSFNDRHFTRVSPAGMRYDNSNMSPWKGWECGCQLVALNYQKADRHLRFNQAMFPDVVGYRLKSPNFCGPNVAQEYMDKVQRVNAEHRLTIRLEIVYGTDLLRGIDPYVTVSCASTSSDFQRAQTVPVYGNSKNPYWGEVFQFDLEDSRSAAVELGVWDRKTGKIACYGGFHADDTRQGLRAVTLHDPKTGVSLRRTHLMCVTKLVRR